MSALIEALACLAVSLTSAVVIDRRAGRSVFWDADAVAECDAAWDALLAGGAL